MDEMAGRLDRDRSDGRRGDPRGRREEPEAGHRRQDGRGRRAPRDETRWARPRASRNRRAKELRDLVDSIQNRRERELARLVKELKNAENELREDLRKQQAENLRKTREARKNPNAKERQRPAQDDWPRSRPRSGRSSKRQLQRLAKLSADAAAQGGAIRLRRMGQAQENMDQDQGERGRQEGGGSPRRPEEAQEELEDSVRNEAEEQLAIEQLARMGDQLKSHRRAPGQGGHGHRSRLRETRARSDGKLTIAQRPGSAGWGRSQAGIKDEKPANWPRHSKAPRSSRSPSEGRRQDGGGRQAARGDQDRRAETMKAARAGRSIASSSSSSR